MKRLSILIVALAVLVCAPARAADEPVPPVPATIPEGVSIGTMPVGGLSAEQATEYVRSQFALPLVLTYGTFMFEAPTEKLAAPSVQRAVQQALVAQPNTTVPLTVTVRKLAIRNFVAEVANRFARKPVDARLFLRKLKPWIAPEKNGREIDRVAARGGDHLGVDRRTARTDLAQAEGAAREGDAQELRAGDRDPARRRTGSSSTTGCATCEAFGVATGQSQYPTPLGRFRVVVKWKNPWWYPPNSAWAKDLEPVPPGPGNPLGTRWMGISSPGVGIHGTPEPGSIGYSVSHGCIRMRIPDAEWLFEKVPVGTTVFIVSA